jgi:RNA recognition motif-containing protein
VQASAACQEKNGTELDGRVIMVREDREDRDIKRGRKQSGPPKAEGESSGLQV